MYKVIEEFVDLKDNNHVYNVGDKFPYDGRVISEERINELSGSDNKRKMPLIAEVKIEEKKSEPVVEEAEPIEADVTEDVEKVKPVRKSRKK